MKNPPVRFGILGTAGIARKVKRAMDLASSAQAVAIASRSKDKAQAWAKEHDLEKAYGSYEDLVNDPDLDAIYIPLPQSMHAEWTIKAAEQGKHILCEKPLVPTFGEARNMADACRSNNVQLMDGVMWVHHIRTAEMKEVIDSGALGTLRRVTAAFTFEGSGMANDNIRHSRELGGGGLGDLGWYCVRAVLWAFEELPVNVYATGRFQNDVDMNLSAILWFEGNKTASFDCGFDTAARKWMEVAGTGGTLICNDYILPEEESASWYITRDVEGTATRHAVGPCIQEARMVENFCEAIHSGRVQENLLTSALDTTRVCEALDQSARSQEPVML